MPAARDPRQHGAPGTARPPSAASASARDSGQRPQPGALPADEHHGIDVRRPISICPTAAYLPMGSGRRRLERAALSRRAGRAGHRDDVLAVRRLRQRLPERQALVGVDEPGYQRDLLQAGDAHALPVFQHLDELAGLQQRIVGAGVQPGETAPEVDQRGLALLHVDVVQVGDLQLAAGAGLQVAPRARPRRCRRCTGR